MPDSRTSDAAIGNKILLSLPREMLEKMIPDFEMVQLPLNEVLYESGERAESILFLNTGLASLIACSSNGSCIEVGAVGNEGLLPIEALSESPVISHRGIVQLPGNALKINIDALKHHFPKDGIIVERSLMLMKQMHNQATQLVLCSRFHTVEQRLCRWLLMTSDWAQNDHFPITHEFLSFMLGVNRATVTTAMGVLKAAGVIAYRQRLLDILDRRRIASISCECYWTHRRDMEHYIASLHIPRRSRSPNVQELTGRCI